jgi:NAD-dependent deacetylase
MKPTVVLFGEPMPQSEVQQAFQLPREADLILMVGSSLVVFPAAAAPLCRAACGRTAAYRCVRLPAL